MVFNTTFNNISVISWQSVLLVEETGVPRENHPPVANHWQTLSHNVISSFNADDVFHSENDYCQYIKTGILLHAFVLLSIAVYGRHISL
jgi:hypothetical protein